VSTVSRWRNWKPGQPQIIETSPKPEPTKPSELSFVGFEGSVSGENQIIRPADPLLASPAVSASQPLRRASKPLASRAVPCPYALPEGVKLVRYTRKEPPVVVTVCSVVEDVPKFVQHALDELDARLHHPVQIKAGDSVFDLLSKLADCGLELRLEWPSADEIIGQFPESEPTKPSEVPLEPDARGAVGLEADLSSEPITDEDLPF